MQKFQMHECADDRHLPPVEVYKVSDVDAEIESLKAQLQHAKEERDSQQRVAIQMQTERDTLRDILKLLVPDLKLMAAAAQAMGNPARARALNNICKGVEL